MSCQVHLNGRGCGTCSILNGWWSLGIRHLAIETVDAKNSEEKPSCVFFRCPPCLNPGCGPVMSVTVCCGRFDRFASFAEVSKFVSPARCKQFDDKFRFCRQRTRFSVSFPIRRQMVHPSRFQLNAESLFVRSTGHWQPAMTL